MNFTNHICRSGKAVVQNVRPPCRIQQRLYSIANARPFKAGDSVLLRRTDDRLAPPIFVPRLVPGSKIDSHKGVIPHDNIIGRGVRELVPTERSQRAKTTPVSDGKSKNATCLWRLHQVKLDDYVRLTRRLVTPLYPQDAALVVNLMDLHVDPPTPLSPAESTNSGGAKLEILEAGTGHGALTLYLSRAIHAANSPFHPRGETTAEELAEWKASRNAVIHSIEISPKHSAHANKVVAGFQHGLYVNNVDFHVSSVGDWVSSALALHNGQPFLSRAFLDLPGSDSFLSDVTKALRTDAMLIVFNPSISQIMDCYERVKAEGMELDLERVVELGVNGGSGGREWDVRAVKPRSSLKKIGTNTTPSGLDTDADGSESSDEAASLSSGDAFIPSSAREHDGSPIDETWKMICRPKVGDMVVGGGFLAVFRKQRNSSYQSDS
ncbi:Hypothetical protein R9X50_00096400 [Acrodontium crateriforme]|uniref:tRNA (adenine(58)-N(1))-methyltransferase catalytic subunit TRM61 n=1 Tax=Acrodontium crateriforme TaxID=150365 RepID=A0AAQ3LYI1_9PEZI|nr:Hypothetical protein R9X50_00096400 [Acrodontium crateriforme]